MTVGKLRAVPRFLGLVSLALFAAWDDLSALQQTAGALMRVTPLLQPAGIDNPTDARR